MSKGISVYLGLHYTLEENLQYIKYAKEQGFSSIFTSLHIPEANYKQAIEDFKAMVAFAGRLDMNVIADISPRTFTYLECDMKNLKPLKELGLYGIRVDFGFDAAEIAEFTRNPYGMKIEINASTVTEKFLYDFDVTGKPDYSNIQACHNYYPRLNTGISQKTLEQKNQLLRKYGVQKIAAFIPSRKNKRGPIFEGLPTLEMHRRMEPQIAAKHLFALGNDCVIFGDSIPSKEEIQSVGVLDKSVIELHMEVFRPNPAEMDILLNSVHVNRPDDAEDVVRSTRSRELLKDPEAMGPHDTIDRKTGCITIDNREYLRYCGELQICKKDLPGDQRVNVVGKMIDEEIFLLDYIQGETPFRFIIR